MFSVAPGTPQVSRVVASWLGEVIRWPTGAQMLNLGDQLGPKCSIWLSEGGPISDHFLPNSSIYEAKGVQIEAPTYASRKVLKKM